MYIEPMVQLFYMIGLGFLVEWQALDIVESLQQYPGDRTILSESSNRRRQNGK
jgi:hypothetical protein